jgi:2,5-diketo-D-gluconate reductase A
MAPDAPDVPTDTVSLPSGAAMPLLGFGTWQITGEEAVTATATALDAGYRHLDTATVYRNEAEVGRGLRDSGVPREKVFVTTKCRPNLVGRERETIEQSLQALGIERVDLWLIHAPPSSAGERKSMWEAFVRAQEDGLVRDIGVSNFSLDQVDELVDATGVEPAVNQIEWSPLLFDADVLEGHRSRDVVLEGYSGLRGGTLTDPTIGEVADRLGRTPAQVIVRWHLQHGTVVIPKSSKADRIRSNADVDGFELTDQDMAALDALGG